MKRYFSFLIALFFLTSSLYSGIEDVKGRYTINGNRLVAHDGKEYKRLSFRDSFHERMAWVLMDSEYSEGISRAFHAWIVPTLHKGDATPFGNALVKVCQLFSSDVEQSEKALVKALQEEGFPYETWSAKHPYSIKQFFSALYPNGKTPERQQGKPMRIAIMTTSSSGGNLSVAQAIESLLENDSDRFEVTTIDYEAFAEKHDPIMIATGTYTKDNIYRILQQESLEFGIDQLIDKDMLCYEVAKYIPYRTAGAIKEYIRSLQPDMIISTRNYYADDFNLLSLQIPFRMLNCDHDINFFHEPFVGKVDSQKVKFWLPSTSPRFFKNYFSHAGRSELYNEKDDWNTLLQKVADVSNSSFEEISQQFEVLGYPVRLEFEPIKDQEVLQEMRERWALHPDEKGVIVEMGANGLALLEEIFRTLEKSPPHEQPIKYYFICGRNTQLKEKLQQEIARGKLAKSALAHCAVLGWVEAKEKNELMNISSLMIGKPGGSTQAELTRLQLPLFIVHVDEHSEEGNKEKLLRSHLAFEMDSEKPLAQQVEEVLDQAENTELTINDPDWKKNLLQCLL